MTTASTSSPAFVAMHAGHVPAWARPPDDRTTADACGGHVSVRGAAAGTLLSIVVRDARALPAGALADRVREAYGAVFAALADRGLHAQRLWNVVPGILDPIAGYEHRYMAFNRGRYEAYADRYRGGLPQFVAASSGVGHQGDDLAIHCLAGRLPGVAIENPRQTPAWRYSSRYGPVPPCFARATLVPDGRQARLYVSGTASVRGEDSAHRGDLPSQIRETVANLAALLGCGLARWRGRGDGAPVDSTRALGAFASLRVYACDQREIPAIEARLRGIASGTSLEYVVADLCRPDLRVEIEGVVDAGRLAGFDHDDG